MTIVRKLRYTYTEVLEFLDQAEIDLKHNKMLYDTDIFINEPLKYYRIILYIYDSR